MATAGAIGSRYWYPLTGHTSKKAIGTAEPGDQQPILPAGPSDGQEQPVPPASDDQRAHGLRQDVGVEGPGVVGLAQDLPEQERLGGTGPLADQDGRRVRAEGDQEDDARDDQPS